jgi:hypothetical protein
MGLFSFPAICDIMECTAFDLLYRSSHLMISSGETLLLDRSMYPVRIDSLCKPRSPEAHQRRNIELTLLLVNSEDHNDFVPSHSHELLNTTDSSPTQFAEQDHAFSIVVFQQFHIGAHLSYLTDLAHDDLIGVRERFLVIPHGLCRDWRRKGGPEYGVMFGSSFENNEKLAKGGATSFGLMDNVGSHFDSH